MRGYSGVSGSGTGSRLCKVRNGVRQMKSDIEIQVDVTNPGHFFACCGLLELAHRQWSRVEGCFNVDNSKFEIFIPQLTHSPIEKLLTELRKCTISGLSIAELEERDFLESEGRELRKSGEQLSPEREERRKHLGGKARKGAIQIGTPFSLYLNWWQTPDDDSTSPKTWAGKQELNKIAQAAQEALPTVNDSTLFNYGAVLREPLNGKSRQQKKVEPFYFDARRFTHALDTGFSLDTQDVETIAYPAVELLCLIGLQRFRPMTSKLKRNFEYQTWTTPISAPIAAAVASCAVPISGSSKYRFGLNFRDSQKRYKAFGFATQIGD